MLSNQVMVVVQVEFNSALVPLFTTFPSIDVSSIAVTGLQTPSAHVFLFEKLYISSALSSSKGYYVNFCNRIFLFKRIKFLCVVFRLKASIIFIPSNFQLCV
jgi:hypothetical protein